MSRLKYVRSARIEISGMFIGVAKLKEEGSKKKSASHLNIMQ